MSVQNVANRWIENGLTQLGIKPILNSAFETLSVTGPGYCNVNTDKFTGLPGQPASTNQIILEKEPYGPANCNQYASLIKPGVNPLTLRGISNPGVIGPVSDSPICLQTCDYMEGAVPIRGTCSNICLRTTQYCTGDKCNNDAPGGLADWMGTPISGPNIGTWGSAINKQLSAGKNGSNGYNNPITLFSEPQMKFGFVTEGCECHSSTPRIAGGTLFDWEQGVNGPGSGPFTLNTDAGVMSEVWNGQGECDTWENTNQNNLLQSTCNLDIIKYAQTCAWCKTAALIIPSVQSDQTYPPSKTVGNFSLLGTGTSVVNPSYCTFGADSSGNYTIDNGDCLGFGANGTVRIPCNHPIVSNLDCPVTDPSSQKIGLSCNVPAQYRLTGQSCAFVQIQDLLFMSKLAGSNSNNYWISYSDGNFSVNLSGSTDTSRSSGGAGSIAYSQVITGGRQIAITFPNGTLASALLSYLQSQFIFASEIDSSVAQGTGASLNNPQNSTQSVISLTINTGFYAKIGTIQGIQYQYTDSKSGGICLCNGIRTVSTNQCGSGCSWTPGTASYYDGNVTINYSTGNLGVTMSGTWNSRSQTNVVNITFPDNLDANTIIYYVNSQFASATAPNSQAVNLVASLAYPNPGPQISSYAMSYYAFGQGEDAKTGGIVDPGNCNIKLDGTQFTGTWQNNTDTTQPWLGKQGIACDFFPNQGTCQTMLYDPNASGDCQICDSDLWKWIPGGVDAVVDPSNTLHNLAISAYIPKLQNLKIDSTCQQVSLSPNSYAISYCGIGIGNNSCQNVCGQNCAEMNWETGGTPLPLSTSSTSSLTASAPSIVDNLITETGGLNIPTGSGSGACANSMCERNPVLTLRGTSEEENIKLVTNWMNGIFDLSEFHGVSSGIQNTTTPDLRAYGISSELEKRTIKAMRCCLGINPGFQSSDGGINGSAKTAPDADPYGGLEMWDLYDCPPGTMCPNSDTCKNLYKSVLDGSNQNVTMNLNDFGASSYPNGFSLDRDATSGTSEDILLNPAYYAKAYCEMASGGSSKNMTTVMGLDDEINTICRKTMYNYCSSPVEVDVINDSNYWNAPIGASSPPSDNLNYSKTTYELPLKIFTQGCNMWFKNQLQEVMPSDYGTRDMLIGSACQRLQVDGWYNPIGPDQSPLLQSFVTNDGKIKDKSGYVFDLSYVGSANQTSGDGSIPGLLANTCNCFLLGSKCQGSSGSNCSYQYCGAGIENPLVIDFGHSAGIINPLNQPVDLTPYTDKLGLNGDSSWTKYQDVVAPSWTTGLDSTNFTCAKGNAPQGMTISGNESGGSSNCFTGCNYINEYDVCWNASPINRKYSGELLGGNTKWNCKFNEGFSNINICDPTQSDSYSCFGNCENGTTKKDGTQFPNCGTQTWFDSNLSLSPGEIKAKQNRSLSKSNVMDTPYWQNFYSGASEQVSSASIPNIGSIYNPSRSELASDSTCGSPASIKPYNLQFTSQNQCIISQGISTNNQGVISGSVGVSQLGSCNTNSIFQGHNQYDFLTYMGSNDCTGQDTICWNNNNFCLTDGSNGIPAGENCMACGSSKLSSIDAPTKPNTCCLSPNLSNDPGYQTANTDILNKVTLGDSQTVSYFCSSTSCPIGSTDLGTLQASCGTNFTCSGKTDQTSCEGCEYCKWQPIYSSGPGNVPIDTGNKQCVAVCPSSPQNGWNGVNSAPVTSPASSPASSPVTSPVTSPDNSGVTGVTGVTGTIPNLSNADIVFTVVGIVLLVAFIINAVVVWKKSRKL